MINCPLSPQDLRDNSQTGNICSAIQIRPRNCIRIWNSTYRSCWSHLTAFVVAALLATSLHGFTLYQKNFPFCGCQDSDTVIVNVSAGGAPDGTYTIGISTDPGGLQNYSVTVLNGVCTPAQVQRQVDAGYGGQPAPGRTWSVTIQHPEGGVEWASGADFHGGDTFFNQCPTCTAYTQTVAVSLGGTAPSVTALDDNQTRLCDANTGCAASARDSSPPMAQYSIHLLLASLHIEDTPVSYRVPRGPATQFKLTYNQREAKQPSPFPFGNLGARWTFNWLSYVTDNPGDQTTADVSVRGGGTETYIGFNTGTQSYSADKQSMAVLVRTSSSSYERRFPDGSKEIFSVSDLATSYPRRVFLTSVVDATGASATIGYDTSFRITSIADSLGQATTLSYELTGDSLKITKITDPFGRYATIEYTNGQLTKITDPLGIQSQFAYETGSDFINALTTPYGTTTFAKGEDGNKYRWLEVTDPASGKERVEYRNVSNGVTSTELSAPAGAYNASLEQFNTFYWNKKAMADAPGDYSKARVIHWLKAADGKVSGIKHSEKEALENRVWYSYLGQTDGSAAGANALPISIARVLDDATTQLSLFEYSTVGNLTKETDPVGRVFSYVYDTNGIDLLEKRQIRGTNNELLASFTYNSLHEPLTATDAAREQTTYTYNSYGQVRTVTNAKSEITTFAYDRDQNSDGVTDGYLLSVTGNVAGATTTYVYDSAKRIQSVTDSEGYALTIGYDNIDRLTSITYPDATTKQFRYTKYVNGVDSGTMTLDLGASKDRRGQWSYREYNANRQITKSTDPLGRSILYQWCTCGALEWFKDGNSNQTLFASDVQGRITSRTFPAANPNATPLSVSYAYENTTSRLKSMTDGKNQVTNYQYFADNDLKQISYTGAVVATPTASFTYDPNYNRVATMVDGTGTTLYAYNAITGSVSIGAGKLASVDGPLSADTITYTYDELGRRLSSSVNAVAASQTYDSLGRVGTITNPLGTFTNNYLSTVSPRLQSTTIPSRPTVTYSYYANSADKRLQTILNSTSTGTMLSKFDYFYDADGEITELDRQLGATAAILKWRGNGTVINDAADQMKYYSEQNGTSTYTFQQLSNDAAGNHLIDVNGTYTFNNVNQITNAGYIYDNNGNLVADPWRSYEWDAADRLVAINYPAVANMRTEFTYDGLGRRVKIVEKNQPVFDWTFQPTSTSYLTYAGPSAFSLTAGTYSLTLGGVNPTGGANTVLLDSVKLLKSGTNYVVNGSFENPTLTGSNAVYNPSPSNATWTFVGSGGISRNGNAIASGNPVAPLGTQLGFLQTTASSAQNISGLNAGSYTFSVQAAQRTANATYEQLRVTLQTTTVGVTSTKQFIWNGNGIAEERDANNAVLRRFYPQGEQISGLSYYYTRDHLGSVRELVDSTGAVRARYNYDPYGQRTKVSGDLDAEFGFTGHYYHQPSSLSLALYRAYDAYTGKWISRDPIDERGGLNLYRYVGNDPLRFVDPAGLAIVVNNTDRPVVVSGNIGLGHGTPGGQAFGIISAGRTGGGKDNPLMAYPTREDAIRGTNPLAGTITDVDFYDSFLKKEHSANQCDYKIVGDEQGPTVTLTVASSSTIFESYSGLPGAYARRGWEIINNYFGNRF